MVRQVRVLVACEFSGTVRDAFRANGHDAWSCDLLPCTGDPTYHYQGNVLDYLYDSYGWDLLIAHPPCTYLASSGLHWNSRIPGREKKTEEAMQFVLQLMGETSTPHRIPMIALENPIGRVSTAYRKPDQIIQPYQFGHNASKATCLWLKRLPLLRPTGFVEPRLSCACGTIFDYDLGKEGCPTCEGAGKVRQIWGNQTPSGQNKLGPSPTRAMERSVTYRGIAKAMADQWGSCLNG